MRGLNSAEILKAIRFNNHYKYYTAADIIALYSSLNIQY